ncbi:MAG: 3-oxoacyl-[acyl-carrier-protein] reductase [Proteobacteria bacterium]|nr:3-oxoacyl-[acyl-carrier-protein] reductase [Pseudomonadota bacterium]
MLQFENRKALVTGATGGIGKVIAEGLHKCGVTVVLSGTREARLKELQQEFGGNTKVLPCDLGDVAQAAGLFDKAEELVGDIDIVVCNAGITRDTLVMRMKDEDWAQVLNLNLSAVFQLNRAAVTKMLRRRYGRIINISSIVGVTGNAGQANYAAAKAGMIGMSKSIAAEVATRNVTVNCVAPGFIATPMTDVLSDAVKQKIQENIPMGRIGSAEEVAAAVTFLASDNASYITGSTIHVNGGMCMV